MLSSEGPGISMKAGLLRLLSQGPWADDTKSISVGIRVVNRKRLNLY